MTEQIQEMMLFKDYLCLIRRSIVQDEYDSSLSAKEEDTVVVFLKVVEAELAQSAKYMYRGQESRARFTESPVSMSKRSLNLAETS